METGCAWMVRWRRPGPASFSISRLAHQGIYSQMSSASAHLLLRQQGSLLLAGLYHLRTRASLLLYRLFPGPEAALLAGILLGDESGIASNTQQAFRETGTAHLIAISGFNISIIGGLFVVLFRCYSAASGGWSRPGWASPPNTDCSRQQGFGAFSSIFHASGFFRFDGESTPTLLLLTPTVDWHMDSGVLYFPIPLNGVERQCWVSAFHHGAHRIDNSSVVIHFAARHDGHGALDPAPYAFRILLQG